MGFKPKPGEKPGLATDIGQDRDHPDRDTRTAGGGRHGTPNPIERARGPLKLRMKGNKRAGDVSPKVRSRRKSRSFRVR